ncbi:MAG TPA: hypothetical protein VM098_04630 [Phycisphaerae bacterium]|nr:hypothetical protein [Phycisphaerae bacterium]
MGPQDPLETARRVAIDTSPFIEAYAIEMRGPPFADGEKTRPMRADFRMLLAVTIGVALLMGGCGNKKESEDSSRKGTGRGDQPRRGLELPKATTPLQAGRNMVHAFQSGTREQFLSCVAGTEDEKKLAGAMYDYACATKGFREDFVKAYGEAAWTEFQSEETEDAPEGPNASLPVIPDDMLEEMEKAQVKIDGDKATLTMEQDGAPLGLIKLGGVWKVDASVLAGRSNLQWMTEKMSKMAELVRKYRKTIGKPGIKPEDIDYELGRATAKFLMGEEPNEPHRFDIEKL